MRRSELLAILLLCLCNTLQCIQAKPKFFLTAPRVFHVGETEKVSVWADGLPSGRAKVLVSVKNVDNHLVHFSYSVSVMNGRHRGIPIRLDASKLRGSGLTYVRLRAQCADHGLDRAVNVLVSQRTGLVFVQTDKPIYNPKQTVNVRVYRIDELRRAMNGSVRLDIMNPDGVILKRYDGSSTSGIFSRSFTLPSMPVLGMWTVVANYGANLQQNESVTFEVKKYVLPHFNVTISGIDDFIDKDTQTILGSLEARYSFDAPVVGRARVLFWVVQGEEAVRVSDPLTQILVNGRAQFSLNMYQVTQLGMSVTELSDSGARLQVEVVVTEGSSGLTERVVNTDCRFATSPYSISTENVPWSFSPALPFGFEIQVNHLNGRPAVNVRLRVRVHQYSGETELPNNESNDGSQDGNTDQWGARTFVEDIKPQTDRIRISASVHNGQSGGVLSMREHWVEKSDMDEQIQLPGKDVLQVGHANIQVQLTNKHVDTLHYMLVSGGRADRVRTTRANPIPVRITASMVPEVRVVVWYIKDNGQVVVASTQRRVARQCERNVEIRRNGGLGPNLEPGDNMFLDVRGPIGATVALQAVDQAVYYLRDSHLLTRDKMFEEFRSRDLGCGTGGGTSPGKVFELSGFVVLSDAAIQTSAGVTENCSPPTTPNTPSRQRRRVNAADPSDCCSSGERYGQKVSADSIDTTCRKGMMTTHRTNSITCRQNFFTCCIKEMSRRRERIPESGRTRLTPDQLPQRANLFPKLSFASSAFLKKSSKWKKLGFHQSHSVKPLSFDADITVPAGNKEVIDDQYYINYDKTGIKLFDPKDKDFRKDFPESWLFRTITIGSSGMDTQKVTLPDSVTTWSVQAVGLSPHNAMCVAQPLEQVAKKDLFLKVHLPYEAVLGEQLQLEATVYNTASDQHTVQLSMTETEGLCCSERAQGGQIKRSRKVLDPGASLTESWTVVPLTTGQLQIDIHMRSSRNADDVRKLLNVVPSGIRTSPAPVSITLDPEAKSSSVLKYTGADNDITYSVHTRPQQKKQTSVLNLKLPQDAIEGTHEMKLGLKGEPLAEVVDAHLRGVEQYIGEAAGCGEQTMGRLGPTVCAARYIRDSGHSINMPSDTATKIDNGETSKFTTAGRSQWSVTLQDIATTLGCLGRDLLPLGCSLIEGVVRMMPFRMRNGGYSMYPKKYPSIWLTAFVVKTFSEAKEFSATLQADPSNIVCSAVTWLIKQKSGNLFFDVIGLPHLWSLRGTFEEKLALTAYVTMAIKHTDCDLKAKDSQALDNTLTYLAGQVGSITNPYTLSVVAYALVKSKHPSGRIAADRLLNMAVTVPGKVPSQQFWQNPSPFSTSTLQDVEATSYGVLALLALGRVTQTNPFVEWLLTQRRADGLFFTTQTSVVGLQALTEYSNQTLGRQVDMTCRVLGKQDTSIDHTFRVNKDPVKKEITVTGAVGGQLEVECEGRGKAQLTLETAYYSDSPTPNHQRCAFNISSHLELIVPVDNNFSGGTSTQTGNDHIRVKVCTQTANSNQKVGTAIVNVGVGTGYEAITESLEKVKRNHEDVDWYELFTREVVFYVKKIPSNRLMCIEFEVVRRETVSKLHPVPIKVYDYYESDHLQCVKFYHPTGERAEVATMKREEQHQCLENICPHCYGYKRTDQLPHTKIKLRRLACSSAYDYVFQGRVQVIHTNEAGVRSAIINITKVGKEGSEDRATIVGEERLFTIPAACSLCPKLSRHETYLIMGKDHPGIKNGRRQYSIDSLSYIVQLTGNKPTRSQKLKNELWSQQREFFNEIQTQSRCRL